MDEPGTNVGAAPFPLTKARKILREDYALGLSAQNEILSAVAGKLAGKEFNQDEFEIALRNQVSVWQQS